MSDIVERLANLSPAKRAILQKSLLDKKANTTNMVQEVISHRPSQSPIPLSFAQQRLWFMDQVEPQNSVYTVPIALHLSGQLNISALEKSFNTIVQRHEVLRTTFPSFDGQPMQVIAQCLPLQIPIIDLAKLGKKGQEEEIIQLTKSETRRPFDLAQGPLLRVILLRLVNQEHILLFTMHHIVTDGWSVSLLLREVSTLYRAFNYQQPVNISELALQYADYALWQHQHLQGALLNTLIEWWKEQLSGRPPFLQLPFYRLRPTVQTFHGTSLTVSLPVELATALKAFSVREEVTLFMTLLAAFQAVLYRYTNQTDIVIGSPIAGRTHSEIENLIGYFANTLALRTNLAGNPTFHELLSRVRETTLGAYAHQDLPFEKLVEELHPERSLSYMPIFQVMFALQNTTLKDLDLPAITIHPLKTYNHISRVDMSLSMSNTDDGLICSLEYNVDLFDMSTMTRLLGHLETLLTSIIRNPNQHLTDLPLLTAVEEQYVLADWNATSILYPHSKSVMHLFLAQAERMPHAIAIVSGEAQISYGELNRRATQLAHYLQTCGVGLEVPIGIYTERSLEMVIGILGIVRAGGAYLPLDPTHPQERLLFMLENASVSLLLTQQKFQGHLPAFHGEIFCLDSDWSRLANLGEPLVLNCIQHERPAYIIYTSGSTGQPKGVLVNHSNLLNLVRWYQQTYQVTAADYTTQIAGISFDASVWELWTCLTAGARLAIPDEETRFSPARLRAWLYERYITLSFLPTPLAESLLSEHTSWPEGLALRILFTGGDRLHIYPDTSVPFTLINLYGPTEATVIASANIVHPLKDAECAPSLGRPIANTHIYILNQGLRPVPIGVPGELYIGGAGLASGYLNSPSLTAERFLPNPFSQEAGARMYKTGDFVRYLENGEIDFIGRKDHQVKIRGYRVEVGEIEVALRQHSTVQEALVIASERDAHEKHLVAYIVIHQQQICTADELRNALKNKLPTYMIPTRFVFLDRLPLTPNGKVDHSMLPLPDEIASLPGTLLPTSLLPDEELLLSIWEEVLGIEHIDLNSNFFEVGGHSLLATQVIARVQKIFGVNLPLRVLFEAPTFTAFAQQLKRTQKIQQEIHLPPIQISSHHGNFPQSYAQQRLWFLDHLEPGNPIYNVPIALRLSGQLDIAALEQSINRIIQRHEALRTTFTALHGQPVQIIAASLFISLTITDLTTMPDAERERTALQQAREEALRPFALQQGPLIRAHLLRLNTQEHLLLLTIHHIVFDGGSLHVFYQELSELYTAYIQQRSAQLPTIDVQYTDYTLWQHQWLQGNAQDTLVAYWRKQLIGASVNLALPFDRPHPNTRTFHAASQAFVLSEVLTQQLIKFGLQEGVTLFMTLLAAYQIVLFQFTNQTDIVIGTDSANRNHAEIEGLIGFFTNQLVLRTTLSGTMTVRELLVYVREMTLGAYAHQELPFARLVEILNPQRDHNGRSLFHTKIVFQNTSLTSLTFPDLTIQPIRQHNPNTQLDLTLFVNKTTQGLAGSLQYNADVFDSFTVSLIIEHFQMLLASMPSQRETQLTILVMSINAQRRQQKMNQSRHQETARRKFSTIKPKVISLTEQNVIKTSYFQEDARLPLVIQPTSHDVDLIGWASNHQEFIEKQLLEHGALLFRNFTKHNLEDFERFALTLCPELFKENSEHVPVTGDGNIQVPIFYAPEKKLLWHNENSFNYQWPLKIWFGCMQPAQQGGETPLVDSRKVFARLDPTISERFMNKGIMYVRNYSNGLGLDWQTIFRTTSKNDVEAICRAEFIECKWKDNDRLCTRSVRPAVIKHPKTHEFSWFNQAQHWHISCLDATTRESLLALFPEEDLPRNCYYGDGTPIEESVMHEILRVYSELEVIFPWQQGDIVMLDNVLIAHARNPYVGSRKQLVALGEMMHFEMNL